MKHWYRYHFRGFSPGCQPEGAVSVDETAGKFGAVAYRRVLTAKEMEEYELVPIGTEFEEGLDEKKQ